MAHTGMDNGTNQRYDRLDGGAGWRQQVLLTTGSEKNVQKLYMGLTNCAAQQFLRKYAEYHAAADRDVVEVRYRIADIAEFIPATKRRALLRRPCGNAALTYSRYREALEELTGIAKTTSIVDPVMCGQDVYRVVQISQNLVAVTRVMGVNEALEENIARHRLVSRVKPQGRSHRGFAVVILDAIIDGVWPEQLRQRNMVSVRCSVVGEDPDQEHDLWEARHGSRNRARVQVQVRSGDGVPSSGTRQTHG